MDDGNDGVFLGCRQFHASGENHTVELHRIVQQLLAIAFLVIIDVDVHCDPY